MHQFAGVRIPIPLVLILCFAVVAGGWWYGTRNTDFLTPPSATQLADVRMRVESSIPPAGQPEDAVSAPSKEKTTRPPVVRKKPKPVISADDFSRPPSLGEYADLAPKGADYLAELAALLENEGQFQRALLAWERVIDSAKPDDSLAATASSAIRRLRPTLPDWNTDPSQAIPITLQAGTGKTTASLLAPVLEQAARELEQASAGILKVTATVTAGKGELTASGPPPVAIWLSGPTKNTRSTEVLSFTVNSTETLPEETRKTLFRILRGYLAREVSQTPPRAIGADTSTLDALNSHISRRSWQELGNMLNLPP